MKRIILLIPMLVVMACSKDKTENNGLGENGGVLTKAQETLVHKGNDFAFDLLKRTYDGDDFVLSPFSLQRALGMALNGAQGDTYDQIQRAMGIPGLPLEEINKYERDIVSQLRLADPQVDIQLADAVLMDPTRFSDVGFTFKKEYVELMRNQFDAEVKEYRFGDPETLPAINRWASEKTKGKISTLIKEFRDETVLLLANALSFHGQWTCAFDKDKTMNRAFRNHNNKVTEIPMMSLCENFYYYENNEIQFVSLPYGNGSYSMVVLLPKKSVSLETAIQGLSHQTLSSCLDQAEKQYVYVVIPKISVDEEKEMTEPLKKMGIQKAFKGSAEFYKMFDAPKGISLYLNEPFQRIHFSMDESGTQASALSVMPFDVLISDGDYTEEPSYVLFLADRPFIYAVRENSTGAVLFLGIFDGD